MTAGRKPGETVRTEGAWLITRRADGTTTHEALLTFDPFREVRPRAEYGTHDAALYAAWKRERYRFERATRRYQNGRPGRAMTGEEGPMRRAG